MKRFSVLGSIALLVVLLSVSPMLVVAETSRAESETSITFSGWGDAELIPPAIDGAQTNAQSNKGSSIGNSTAAKTFPKTGEIFNGTMILLGSILVFVILLFIYKNRGKVENNEM